jgi:AcrR family transcriptional regulator
MAESTKRRPGRPPLHKRDEHEVRKKLIRAAVKLFSQDGFGSTTVRAIAHEAEVNVSLISYYFGSKEGLYRTAISLFGESRVAAARKILTPQSTLEGVQSQLIKFLDELFNSFAESPDLVRLIYRESDGGSPFIEEVIRDTLFEVYRTLTQFFQTVQDDGLLNQQFNPQMAASMVIAGYSQAVRGAKISEKLMNVSVLNLAYRKSYIEQMVSTMLWGLRHPWKPYSSL